MASRHARLAIYAMDPEGYKPEQKHAAARTTYMWQPSTAATIPTPSSPGTSNALPRRASPTRPSSAVLQASRHHHKPSALPHLDLLGPITSKASPAYVEMLGEMLRAQAAPPPASEARRRISREAPSTASGGSFRVFRQNEEGDAFYVITSGTAEVIRRHDDEVDENGNVTRHHHAHKLAELREWHSFGERSLIKNQIRYAGIRATSDILKCCRIDREQFEQALGPLEKVLPDQYRYISGGNFSGFFQASTS